MKKELMKYLNNIVGSTITYSRAGGGAGSIILIEYNKKIRYTMMIYSSWRIEQNNKVIATSEDDITAVTGVVATTVRMLEGKKVISVEMMPFYDLLIRFEDDVCLNIFCNISYNDSVNWDFCIPIENLSFNITNHFEIKKGKYDTNE